MKRAGAFKGALVLLVVASIIISSFVIIPTKASANGTPSWYDYHWQYRKSHVINSATGAGTNYQVRITVHYGSGTDSGENVYLNSKCQTDFDDIRFTDDDGVTLLNYWIEFKVDSDYARVWVKIADNLNTSSATIYIYYGNPSATSAGNAANTMLKYWGFEDGTFGPFTGKIGNDFFQISSEVKKYGNYSAKCTGSSSGRFPPANTFMSLNKVAVEYWSRTDAASTSGKSADIYFTKNGYLRANLGIVDNYTFRYWNGNSIYFGSSSKYTWYKFVAELDFTNLKWNFRIYDSSNILLYSYNNLNMGGTPVSSYYDVMMYHSSAISGNSYWDEIFSRKWVSPEPSHGSWGSEQTPISITLVSPSNNYTVGPSTNVQFKWQATFASGDYQTAFRFQLDNSSIFDDPEIDTGKVTSSNNTTTQEVPSAVGLYYWRVKVWNSVDYESSWSSPLQIIVDGIILYTDSVDVKAQIVIIGAKWAYDSEPIVNCSISYIGKNKITGIDGKVSFSVSDVSEIPYNSPVTSSGETTYGITTVIQGVTVPLHKVKVTPFTIRSSHQITDPVWDDLKGRLSFNTGALTIVETGDYGTPHHVEVDGEYSTNWVYDSATHEVTINPPVSSVALVFKAGGGGSGAGGGGSGGGGGGGIQDGGQGQTPTTPRVNIPFPSIFAFLIVLAAILYIYSEISKPKRISEKWKEKRKEMNKKVKWKKKGRFAE